MKTTIKYTSVLQKIKDIEERNIAFDSLSDEGKRLEIAWDALQLVLKQKVEASNGCYWSDNLFYINGNSKKLQQILNFDLPTCQVCQRGLIMMSQIRLGNSIDSSDYLKMEGGKNNLKGFSLSSMNHMEGEYEGSHYEHPYYPNTEEKLANICCNILINGDFNIKDDTDYLV